MSQPCKPGGVQLSSAKKRRLAALEHKLGPTAPSDACTLVSASQPLAEFGVAAAAGPVLGCVYPYNKLQGFATGPLAALVKCAPASSSRITSRDTAFAPKDKSYNGREKGLYSSSFRRSAKPPEDPSAQPSLTEEMLEACMSTHPSAGDVKHAIATRLQDRGQVLLGNPVFHLTASSAFKRKACRRYSTHLGGRATRQRLCRLLQGDVKYAALATMTALWQDYVAGVLRGVQSLGPQQGRVEQVLCQVDWHGAPVRVRGHKDPRYAGLEGTVAVVTHQTFQIVDRTDRLTVVPLHNAELVVVLPDPMAGYSVVIRGDALINRAAVQQLQKKARTV